MRYNIMIKQIIIDMFKHTLFHDFTIVSLNPTQVYLIPQYMVEFVGDLQQISGFLWVLRFPLPIKLTAMI